MKHELYSGLGSVSPIKFALEKNIQYCTPTMAGQEYNEPQPLLEIKQH